MERKVLVTGGGGFIGSHLIDALLRKRFKVVVVDNDPIYLNKKATNYKVDINEDRMNTIFSEEKPQIVMHLAAEADVWKSQKDPYLDCKTNVLGTIKILDLCVKHKVDKILFASSMSIYGNPETMPCPEDHPKNPLSPYAISKLTAESYILYYNKMRKLRYVIFRLSNVYGPRNKKGFIYKALRRNFFQAKMNIYGDGSQTRDWIYVSDVINAFLLGLEDIKNRIFNVGSGKETTVLDLYDMMREKLRKSKKGKRRVKFTKKNTGDINKICIDNNLLKQRGWKPKTSLSEGLKRTINWFNKEVG